MRKLLSFVLALAMIVSCLSMIHVSAKVEYTTTLENADAESGSTNWTTMHGGTTTVVEEPGNASNHVAKFTPSGQYHSIGFDITEAINGPGVYNVSFRVKAEEGKGGDFKVFITSFKHSGNPVSYKQAAEAQTITDEWSTISVNIELNEAFFEGIQQLKDAGNSNADKFTIRFCGADTVFKSGSYFSYYVDDVKVGIDDGVYEAIKLTNLKEVAGDVFSKNESGVIKADSVVEGAFKKTYTAYNPNDFDVNLMITYQTTHTPDGGSPTWAGINDTPVCVPAGGTAEFKIDAPVVDGKIEVGGKMYAISTFFFRIDMKATGGKNIPTGTDMYVFGEPKDTLFNLTTGTNYSVELLAEGPELPTPAPEATPTPTPEPKPAGIKFNVTQDIQNGYGYWRTTTVGYTAEDVKDGFIVESFDFYNPGTAAVDAIVEYQNGWSSFGYKTPFTVEPGAKKTVTVKLPIIDGKVDGDVALDALAFRVDFQPVKDDVKIPTGTSFIVAAEEGHFLYTLNNGAIYNPATGAVGAVAKEIVYELPKVDEGEAPETKVPTGVELAVKADATIGFIVTSGNVVTAADVKDGEVTKKLIVKNLSDEDMSIQYSLQALVTLDTGDMWAAPDGSVTETWEIAAGETVEIEFTFEVNDDNTVTIKDKDVVLSKLFYRFNFAPSEFYEGAKFVVYGDEAAIAGFSALSNTNFNKTLVYDVPKVDSSAEDTGDFAPVALVATVVFASVALVVVAKKRED